MHWKQATDIFFPSIKSKIDKCPKPQPQWNQEICPIFRMEICFSVIVCCGEMSPLLLSPDTPRSISHVPGIRGEREKSNRSALMRWGGKFCREEDCSFLYVCESR
ncbi:hypothetical protein CDAR_430081 [Caerostris darwini]|uniref:Uncharacterized protein n=1 Tax=Caerostris darwini TaxID=1538125 RepID=A0AAV4WIN7_9ARAC|nr:hypothetical protein CDAR_430081 [Caerostris darwini]